MKKILFKGVSDSRNNGCWVMLAAAAENIRKVSPVEIIFKSLTAKTSVDHQRLSRLNIDLIICPWTRLSIPKVNLIFRWICFIFLPITALFYRAIRAKSSIFPFWKAFLESDLIIDLSGDSISSDYPEYSLAIVALPLVIARILNKPYMLCAQSLGPFKDTYIQKLLIAIIRDASVITTRERVTDDILSNLNIHGNVIPAQDLAFSMEPAPKERVDEICKQEGINPHLSWVGVSVSDLIYVYAFKELPVEQRKEAYVSAMAAFLDCIIENYGMNILFIPHVVIPNIGNDLTISLDILNRMKNHNKAFVLKGLYTGDELKGIIGLCKLFIGSRMHATIGALSQKIPTMTYVYNHKTVGINGHNLKQNEYLVDIRDIKHAELLQRSIDIFQKLNDNSERISNLLDDILPEIINGSALNAWVAINLLEIAGPLLDMKSSKLCTGCGACAGICLSGALKMQYTAEGTLRPRLLKKCNGCNMCKKVCPVLGFNISKEEYLLFGQQAEDPETGVVSKCYKGYSTEQTLRWQSSSGGFVTAILAHLLNTEKVDAVLSVVDDPEDPLRPKAVWISNADDLYKASGSKYTPVAPLEAFRDLRPDFKNIAIVGLPCHLWGIRLLEKNNFLKDKQVVIKLGLFCGRTPSGQSIEFMMRKNNIQPKNVKKVSYRGHGWPGGLKIETQSSSVFYPLDEIWPFLATPYFHSTHCFFCRDFFAHLSDLSFGDAWLPECDGDQIGWSLCLVRSTAGAEMIAACSNDLYLEEIEISRIKAAMAGNIIAKYRQKAFKELLCPEATSIKIDSTTKRLSASFRIKILVRFEHFLSEIGKSRLFKYYLLDYPFNRFMKINSRIISLIKRK